MALIKTTRSVGAHVLAALARADLAPCVPTRYRLRVDRLALRLTLMHVASSTLIVLRRALASQGLLLTCMASWLLLATSSTTVIDNVDLIADDYACMCCSSVQWLLVCQLRGCTRLNRLVLGHFVALTVAVLLLVLWLSCDSR